MGEREASPQTKAVHYHPAFDGIRRRSEFFDASYRGGREYLDAIDPDGTPVLVKLDRETKQNFDARKAMATVRNICRPIVDRTNAYLFGRSRRDQIKRPEDREFLAWAEDVDGDGTTLHEAMQERFRSAQIRGMAWIGLDAPAAPSDAGEGRVEDRGLQADDDDEAPPRETGPFGGVYMTFVDPERVVDWEYEDGVLVRFVVLETRTVKGSLWEEGGERRLLREWTPEAVGLIELNDDDDAVIQDSTPEAWDGEDADLGRLYLDWIPHDFGEVPFVPVSYPGGLSQIAEVSHSQRRIANLKSWGDNELSKTFSTTIITGASDGDVGQMTASNMNVLLVGSPDADIHKFGADPDQAKSLREEREMEEKEVARGANLEASYRSTEGAAAESGEKRRRDLEALYQQVSAMAGSAENAEKEVLSLLARMTSGDETRLAKDVSYPTDFDLADVSELLVQLRELIGLPFIPDSYLRAAVKEFVARRSNRDPRLEQILAAIDVAPPPNDPERADRRFFLADQGVLSPVDLYMETIPPSEEIASTLGIKPDEEGRLAWDGRDEGHRAAVVQILAAIRDEKEEIHPPPPALVDESGKPLPEGSLPPSGGNNE